MMGVKNPPQEKLFCVNVSLDKRVRRNHPLREVTRAIDFDLIYKEVEDCYGTNGHVSVPPPLILKLMLLLGAGWGQVSKSNRSTARFLSAVTENKIKVQSGRVAQACPLYMPANQNS